jgi:hypothetical protein
MPTPLTPAQGRQHALANSRRQLRTDQQRRDRQNATSRIANEGLVGLHLRRLPLTANEIARRHAALVAR